MSVWLYPDELDTIIEALKHSRVCSKDRPPVAHGGVIAKLESYQRSKLK